MDKPAFRFDRLVEYTPEAVVDELQRVAKLVHPLALNRDILKRHGRVGISTVRRHFGTWRRALAAAGIDHALDSKRPVTSKMTEQQAKGMSDDELLNVLRTVSEQLQGRTLSTADFNRLAPISAATVSRRFQGWREALERAGLDASGVRREYSEDECFDNLLKVWTFRGAMPRFEDMARPPSTISTGPYVRRWRTWRRTLKAFVDRVNSDTAIPSGETGLSEPAHPIGPLKTSNSEPSPVAYQRSISVGLRYLVLKRDRFRCVVCGRSPAATPGLELHIDHVVPFARGGKTIADNLRTTCRDCNLGKGVRLESPE